jgi:uncharacterized membrane protein YqjE
MSFFTDNKGQKSMMRLGFAMIHIMALLVIIGVTFAIINRINPDYSGMAVLVGALAALLGVAYAGKVKQKQTEDKDVSE